MKNIITQIITEDIIAHDSIECPHCHSEALRVPYENPKNNIYGTYKCFTCDSQTVAVFNK